MIITDLWLSNFRAHKNLHIKLKTGVTGIVGDNGTGKSSIIEAIQFLMTGELFDGTKTEAINLDASSGYVAGAFILNEKRGRIERHLDSSKVVLKYDGVEYKKATEVKELWDKLLMLNPDIIKKVVIARQGHIPQLFSGDPSVREKVFQRIFLVPPTEKFRAMIWKDYIKQAPPIVPEEDILQLQNLKDNVTADITAIEEELDGLALLTESELDFYRKRTDFIQKCVDDAGKAPALNQALKEAQANLREIDEKVNYINEKLKIDIGKYQRMNTMLLQHKGLYAQKLKWETELNNLKYPFSENEYNKLVKELEAGKINLEEYTRQQANERVKIVNLEAEINQLTTLQGKAHCPTCKQEIKNISEHIELLSGNLQSAKSEFARIEELYNNLDIALTKTDLLKIKYEVVLDRKEALVAQLEQLQNITFDEELLQNTTAVIERYTELKAEKSSAELKQAKAMGSVTDLMREIAVLTQYDGDNPLVELEQISKILTQHYDDYRINQQRSVDLKIKQFELKNINERIKNSQDNHKKNTQRNAYVATLNKAYEVLHTAQFPRKLIMMYSEVVTEYLQENLEMFDIPYTARVADNFKIEMIDEQDRILPTVSGGQEIVVGISLHLALHDLFSQSFPLMVIDEGTTHLDSTNRKAYFDLIKGLKSKSKLKQILIIDHDPQLSEVVDQVVQLKKNE